MEIVSRIKKFLDDNGIPNSQFADNCKIPRPTVSQVLNGRNKKISDELIAKIHHAYPALSITWLLFGEGSMIDQSVAQSNSESVQTEPELTGTDFFTDNHVNDDEQSVESQNGIRDALRPVMQASADSPKRITNIVVFYNDNSFQSFLPSQL